MRFTRTLGLLVLAAVLALVISSTQPAQASASGVVISAVYGGGGSGSGTPPYNRDYIELFNAGSSSVGIGGWSVQYSSASNGNWSGKIDIPASTTLAIGQYYFIITGSAGAVGSPISVTPDIDAGGAFSISASAGSV
ncbi:MAG: lamin tail domain-containing protein, partial [Anaerolineae bacterium]|nr:lamin tail domain-containing protein [Anaerolineae bacterium]